MQLLRLVLVLLVTCCLDDQVRVDKRKVASL